MPTPSERIRGSFLPGPYRREVSALGTFQETLSEYTSRLHCTSKQLTIASGLSAVVISRYRSGERTPLKNSPQFSSLVKGLALLCKEKGLPDTEEEIEKTLKLTLPRYDATISPERFRDHLVTLVKVTQIPMSHMAKALSYDPSYLSKICSAQRFPSSPGIFIEKLCSFVADHYETETEKKQLGILLNLNYPDEESDFRDALIRWFHNEES